MNTLQRLGVRIKELRNEVYLTQKELAKILKVDDSYISKIEKGYCEDAPSLDLLMRIAEVFDVSSDDLIDLAGYVDYGELREVVKLNPLLGRYLRDLCKALKEEGQ